MVRILTLDTIVLTRQHAVRVDLTVLILLLWLWERTLILVRVALRHVPISRVCRHLTWRTIVRRTTWTHLRWVSLHHARLVNRHALHVVCHIIVAVLFLRPRLWLLWHGRILLRIPWLLTLRMIHVRTITVSIRRGHPVRHIPIVVNGHILWLLVALWPRWYHLCDTAGRIHAVRRSGLKPVFTVCALLPSLLLANH